jgi:hypothetical protein
MEGVTVDQLSMMVAQIAKEFKSRQTNLQPLMNELRSVKQTVSEMETEYFDKRAAFEKMTVGLEMEKLALEKDCDDLQVNYFRASIFAVVLNNLTDRRTQ